MDYRIIFLRYKYKWPKSTSKNAVLCGIHFIWMKIWWTSRIFFSSVIARVRHLSPCYCSLFFRRASYMNLQLILVAQRAQQACEPIEPLSALASRRAGTGNPEKPRTKPTWEVVLWASKHTIPEIDVRSMRATKLRSETHNVREHFVFDGCRAQLSSSNSKTFRHCLRECRTIFGSFLLKCFYCFVNQKQVGILIV